jgi:hypothetical protein
MSTFALAGLVNADTRRAACLASAPGYRSNRGTKADKTINSACTFYLVFKEPRRPLGRAPLAGSTGVRGTFQLYDNGFALSTLKCQNSQSFRAWPAPMRRQSGLIARACARRRPPFRLSRCPYWGRAPQAGFQAPVALPFRVRQSLPGPLKLLVQMTVVKQVGARLVTEPSPLRSYSRRGTYTNTSSRGCPASWYRASTRSIAGHPKFWYV